MSLTLFGMDLFTLTVHNIAPGILAGMIANSGDRRFCNVMGTIVERLKNGGPPVNHDLQKAVRRAYLQATLCVCHQCMADQGVKPSLIRRNISDILFPSETARALDLLRKRLEQRLKRVADEKYVPPHGEIDDQVALLLQPRDVSAQERLAELRGQLKGSILYQLERWQVSTPVPFIAMIRDGWDEDGKRIDWFDLMCGFFCDTLKTDAKVQAIFQDQLLVGMDVLLENMMDGMDRFNQKVDCIGEDTRQIRDDLGFIRRRIEDGCAIPASDEAQIEYLPLPESRDILPPVQLLPRQQFMKLNSRQNGFVGRVADMWALHDALQAGGTAIEEGVSGGGEPVGVVMGTGGLGKTQLAVEYVHRFGFLYPGGVFWIPAEQGMAPMAGILSKHGEATVDPKAEPEQQIETVWHEFNRRGRDVLLVLDNFPEDRELGPWLPPGKAVRVVVTTRRRDLTRYGEVRLNFMTPEEGARLINMGRDMGEDAKRISEALGGLPLALELARHYLKVRPVVTADSLLADIAQKGEMKTLRSFEGKYTDQMPSGHTKEVAATICMSWELASENARQMMQALALLAPVSVPRRLVSKIFKEMVTGDLLDDPVDEALGELDTKLSLIELDEELDPVVHRLIAGFVGETAEADTALCERVIEAVETEMSRVGDVMDTAAFRELEKVAPHAERLLDAAYVSGEQKAEVSNWLRWHYWKWGQYRTAERFGRRSLALAEEVYEPGHPEIAIRQSNLGLVLKDLGDLEGAREVLQKALKADEENLPSGHPSIASSQSNLGLVLKDLGDLEGARELLQKALKAGEQNLPPGHPSIATRQSNLATVLQALGDLEGARELLQKALKAGEENLPPRHPEIAIRQSNLGLVLKDLGDLEGARELLQKTLETFEQNMPSGHPHIAQAQSNLGTVLQALGELEGARELLQKALKANEENLPPGHPSIASSQHKLACILCDLKAYDAALELEQQAYQSRREKLGLGHHHTKSSEERLEKIQAKLKEG